MEPPRTARARRTCVVVSTVSLSLVLAMLGVLAPGCGGKEISPRYDPRPGLALVTVERGGGLPYPGDDMQPLFQLFGDGSFVKYDEEADIFVRGILDEVAVEELLRGILEEGFFELEDEYEDPGAYDATYRRIAVDLEDGDKSVTVWMMEDVPGFDAAIDFILDFPSGEVTEYIPEEGYLVVVKYPVLGNETYDFLDPAGEVYGLLPDSETLNEAVEGHIAVAVDGASFMRLREYEKGHGSSGLYVLLPDAILAIYPVYDPRIVDKP